MGIHERKRREKEKRRQDILLSAKSVFTSKGYSKTTIEDIAKEAELSPGTLYLYFKNKDELYASLSLKVLQFMHIRLQHLDDDKTLNSEQKFNALKDVMYDVYDYDPLILINMFHLQSSETLKSLSPDLIDEIKKLSRSSLSIMANIFKEGIDAGGLLDRHPVALADIMWAVFSGIVLWEESKRIINDEKDYLKPTLEIAFEIIQRGITIKEKLVS